MSELLRRRHDQSGAPAADGDWIDTETRALLNLLADSIATAKVLLLVNHRPEYPISS
jgi:hypothetical protein